MRWVATRGETYVHTHLVAPAIACQVSGKLQYNPWLEAFVLPHHVMGGVLFPADRDVRSSSMRRGIILLARIIPELG